MSGAKSGTVALSGKEGFNEMTVTPNIAVIIPHYNDVDRLRRCLEALRPQLDDRTEVIVADNNSDHNISGVITKFPFVRFVVEPAIGPGLARNRGVAETSAPCIAFLDADCVPESNWLEAVRRYSGLDRVTGGAVEVFDETDPPRSGAEAFEAVFAFNQEKYLKEQGFLVTANMVLSRRVFEATGPFRTLAVPEDLDWCQRATTAGFPIEYVEDLRVLHPSRQDWAALEKKWRRVTGQAFEAASQGGTSRIGWAIRALLMPVSIFVHAPQVLRHSNLSPGEKFRALATLLRLRLTRMGWMLSHAMTGRA